MELLIAKKLRYLVWLTFCLLLHKITLIALKYGLIEKLFYYFIERNILDSEVISSKLGVVDAEVNASIDACGILDLQDINEHITVDK